MKDQFVFHEPDHIDFDRFGHTGKFFGTHSDMTGHLIIETVGGYQKSLIQHECEYSYYVIDGSGKFIANGQSYPCAEGDLIVIPPGNVFTFEGNLKMLLINTPTYTPEQNEELPKAAAYKKLQ